MERQQKRSSAGCVVRSKADWQLCAGVTGGGAVCAASRASDDADAHHYCDTDADDDRESDTIGLRWVEIDSGPSSVYTRNKSMYQRVSRRVFLQWARRKQINLEPDLPSHLYLSIVTKGASNRPCSCNQNRGGCAVESGCNTTVFNCAGISNEVSLVSSIVAGVYDKLRRTPFNRLTRFYPILQ
jgi:hypothetical protein